MAPLPKFAHRSNLDGTIDSICPRCIATVATAFYEEALLTFEREHVCDPVMLERFDQTKPPSSEPVEEFQTSRVARTADPTRQ